MVVLQNKLKICISVHVWEGGDACRVVHWNSGASYSTCTYWEEARNAIS